MGPGLLLMPAAAAAVQGSVKGQLAGQTGLPVEEQTRAGRQPEHRAPRQQTPVELRAALALQQVLPLPLLLLLLGVLLPPPAVQQPGAPSAQEAARSERLRAPAATLPRLQHEGGQAGM